LHAHRLSATRQLSGESAPATRAAEPIGEIDARTKLNLIVRGLFVGVVDHPEYMELWIPSFSDHKYGWEGWGTPIGGEKGLVALTAGVVHELKGLLGGPVPSVEDLQPSVNTVLQDVELNDAGLYAKVRLPYPRGIWPLRKTQGHGVPFYEDGKDARRCMVRQPEQIASMVVFEYLVDDLDKLKVEGRNLIPDPTTNTINLHIWVDGVPEDHVAEPLTPDELTIRNVMGLDIRLNRDMWADQTIVDPEEPLPFGMSPGQLYSRQERARLDEETRARRGIKAYELVEA
jgi:hypothetical protein